jgi:CcmD family protein
MYDFLSQNELYIVLIIVLICWLGLFLYLFRLDKKIKKLEKM